ncbi:hypothetical protein WDW89_03440 [Deltaproteobacteria bacterium TL4]
MIKQFIYFIGAVFGVYSCLWSNVFAGPPSECSSQAIQIISWNISNFDKAKTKQDLEAIAKIINDADIVAFQGISTAKNAFKVISDLDDHLSELGYLWSYVLSEDFGSQQRYAFFWKPRKIKQLSNKSSSQLELKDFHNDDPFIGVFSAHGQSLILINVNATRSHKKLIGDIQELLSIVSKVEEDKTAIVSMVGNFNSPFDSKPLQSLRDQKWQMTIKEPTMLQATEVKGEYRINAFDNILLRSVKPVCASGVIDTVKNLKLKQAREISSHLPVYIWIQLEG